MLRAGCMVALAAAVGCRRPDGGLHVVIDGRLQPGSDFDRLTLEVSRLDGESIVEESLEAESLRPLPVSFNLLSGPSTPPGTELRLRARAYLKARVVSQAEAQGKLLTATGGEMRLWLPDPAVDDGGLDAGLDAGPADAGTDAGDDGGDAGVDGGRPDGGDAGIVDGGLGSPCSADAGCGSGLCIDGVCCSGLCPAPCDSCNLPGSAGICAPSPAGTQNASCGIYACNGLSSTCPNQCLDHSHCAQGYYCKPNRQCGPQEAIGKGCKENAECLSGDCVDGFCCDTDCDQPCDVCNVAGRFGTCTVMPAFFLGSPSCEPYRCSGTSGSCTAACVNDTFCAGTAYCTDGGQCALKQANGSPCSSGARECQSGNCVDGYCCNSGCLWPCDACDLAGRQGICSIRDAGSDGEPSCSPYLCGGSLTCATSCSGDAGCAAGFSCSSSSSCIDKLSSLKDDFGDNLLDPALWSTFESGVGRVFERNTRLEVELGASDAGLAGVTSRLAGGEGSSVVVELLDAGPQVVAGLSAALRVERDALNSVAISVSGGRIRAQKQLGGAWSEMANLSYSLALMRYLRIREQGGTTYWEYSQDRLSFAVLHQEANPILMREVRVVLSGRIAAPDTAVNTVAFDNLNSP
ncbi:MAG: hypothetical protein HYZ28_18045 [Myxococcales bacterium]|nr:hypothetical protein [Myxococcales bacterium]